jgi:TonB family protein
VINFHQSLLLLENDMNKSFLVVLFILTFCVFSFGQDSPKNPQGSGSGRGTGSGSGIGSGSETSKPGEQNADGIVPLRILTKPAAAYTDLARMNAHEGEVRLRVTFLDSGEIGSVIPVTGLPYGLTEQAIAAARGIKFEPQMKNGVAVIVTKLVVSQGSIDG